MSPKFLGSIEECKNDLLSLNKISQKGNSSCHLCAVIQCSKGNATCLKQMANYHWESNRMHWRDHLLIPTSEGNSGAASQSKLLYDLGFFPTVLLTPMLNVI